MNVQVDATPNVERVKIVIARGDGGDIHIGMGMGNNTRSKIISHFIKGKISRSPMETILIIPSKLEYLEGLMKLLKWIEMNCCNKTKVQQRHQLFPI
jgi:hypothetical protein